MASPVQDTMGCCLAEVILFRRDRISWSIWAGEDDRTAPRVNHRRYFFYFLLF